LSVTTQAPAGSLALAARTSVSNPVAVWAEFNSFPLFPKPSKLKSLKAKILNK